MEGPMLNRLRKMLVQEVPEELSACAFKCSETRCTYTMWAECSLRSNDFPEHKNAVDFKAHTARTGKPISLDGDIDLLIYT
jgi:hypothetical protein